MASNAGGKGGGGDAPIMVSSTQEVPHGLLDFISDLEYKHTQELKGMSETLVAEFFTTKDRTKAVELGFRQTFLSGIITALMTPIAIGVVEKMIPVFGSTVPTTMDQIYIFFLTFSYLIGYAYFLGYAATRFYGGYTQTMVKFMLIGVFTSAFLKAVIIFILFNFLYIKVVTEENILQALTHMAWIPWVKPRLYDWYQWLVEFRGVLPWSATLVVLTTIIYCIVIAGCYLWALRRNRLLREAGCYK